MSDGSMPLRNLRTWNGGLAALLLALAAGQPLCAQDATTAEVYSAHGTVVNSLTGQGIPRALVTLNDQYAALTGGDGEFSIDNLPPGSYFASVNKPGYLGFGTTHNGMEGGVRNGVHIPGAPPRRIRVGPDMPDVTFRVAPAATIMGEISLSTADPADGIRITLYRRRCDSVTRNGRWPEILVRAATAAFAWAGCHRELICCRRRRRSTRRKWERRAGRRSGAILRRTTPG
jgi:hypothetical protein